MTTTANRVPSRLALAETPLGPAVPAAWIGSLVVLGSRACHYADSHPGRQLVVTVSVPRRDFAALLIGCGWIAARPAPVSLPVMDILRQVDPGRLVRVVTTHKVIVDRFVELNESTKPPRLVLAGSPQLQVTHIRQVRVLEEPEEPVGTARPHPGVIGRMARLEETWDARLAAPAADLAIVGTLAWLREELNIFLRREGDPPDQPGRLADDLARAAARRKPYRVDVGHGSLADVILPRDGKVSTWYTRLYAASRLPDQLPLPKDLAAVVLDGNGAIKHLAEIETPVVICILDRSVADESAAELIVQLRNTRGELVSISQDLRWRPPTGVEALAFTVAL